MPDKVQPRAFTVKYQSLSRQLTSEIKIENNSENLIVLGLWDTGATNTCISHDVVSKLGLIPVGKINISTPSGHSQQNYYIVDVLLPNHVGIREIHVIESEIGNQGIGILIGMDVIGFGDFAVSNCNGITQFSFRTPSMSEADFVNNQFNGYKGIPHVKDKEPERNEKCPCGSGKKYKNCCGARIK